MGREQRIPAYQLLRFPAFRRQELCLGSFKEQENLPIDAKRKGRKPYKGEPESIEAIE